MSVIKYLRWRAAPVKTIFRAFSATYLEFYRFFWIPVQKFEGMLKSIACALKRADFEFSFHTLEHTIIFCDHFMRKSLDIRPFYNALLEKWNIISLVRLKNILLIIFVNFRVQVNCGIVERMVNLIFVSWRGHNGVRKMAIKTARLVNPKINEFKKYSFGCTHFLKPKESAQRTET